MPLVTQTIRNLIQGVSQQPPILRHAEQLDVQINGFSTEAGGLQKRPPSRHIKKLPNIELGAKLHFINRDESERYFLTFTGSTLKVFDLNGDEKTVRFNNGADTYIQTNDPKGKIKAVTVADYTFIINTDKTVEMDMTNKTPDAWANQGALVVVKSGQYGRNYTIYLNGQSYTFTTPDGSQASHSTQIATDYITNQLKAKLGGIQKLFKDLTAEEMNTYGVSKHDYFVGTYYKYKGREYRGEETLIVAGAQGFNFVSGSNWIQIIGNINDVSTKDGFNNDAIKLFTTTAQSFNELPSTAPGGYIVLIKGESNSDDDYYVTYSHEDKIWEETTAPNITRSFLGETMPYTLRREADGTFTMDTADWGGREAGDEDSNPTPSFVGNKINDIFFFRNRLGIVSGESVNLSKTGDFFNFWVDSATGIVDTDPIDLSVSHNQISTLYNAVPFNQDLYLFSGQTQFILRAEGVLSPKTAIIDQVTEFNADRKIKPIGIGRNLYFTAQRTDYTTVREYYTIASSTTQQDSADITGHVPNYIKNNVDSLIACNNENMLVALSTGERDTFFVYKFLFSNESKVQASWSKWTVDGNIVGADFIGSTLYFVLQRGNQTFLEMIPINYNTKDYSDEPYRVMLDRKQRVTLNGTHDALKQTMNYDLKSYYGDDTSNTIYTIVLPNGEEYSGLGTVVIPNQPNPVSDLQCFIGVGYEFKFRYTTFFIKKASESGTDTIPNYRLQLRNLRINYADTGEFQVNVQETGKSIHSYKMTARYTGYGNNIVSTHPLETGEFRVPIMGRNTDTTIEVVNGSPLPSAFNSTIWQGNVTYRYKNI